MDAFDVGGFDQINVGLEGLNQIIPLDYHYDKFHVVCLGSFFFMCLICLPKFMHVACRLGVKMRPF